MRSALHLRPAPDAAVPGLRLVERPRQLLPAEEAVGVSEDALERNDFAVARRRADEAAADSLVRAVDLALEAGREREAADAVSALGRVQLAAGDHAEAERSARRATELLEVLPDCCEELGDVLLVLGRAYLGQDRLEEAEEAFALAERTLAAPESAGDPAAAWIAQGDLARARGLAEDAAERYRTAALALHDARS